MRQPRTAVTLLLLAVALVSQGHGASRSSRRKIDGFKYVDLAARLLGRETETRPYRQP